MRNDNRKDYPLARGVLDYFPDALLEVANVSKIGNDQHNPGEPMHWAKEKSMDEPDALLRHLIDRGKRDTDGLRHSAKVAWRALALLQREIDMEKVLVSQEAQGSSAMDIYKKMREDEAKEDAEYIAVKSAMTGEEKPLDEYMTPPRRPIEDDAFRIVDKTDEWEARNDPQKTEPVYHKPGRF